MVEQNLELRSRQTEAWEEAFLAMAEVVVGMGPKGD